MTDRHVRTDGGDDGGDSGGSGGERGSSGGERGNSGGDGGASNSESRVREGHLSGDDLTAYVCKDGHATFPGHQRCPACGEVQSTTLDLSATRAEVVTWTTSTATPPGVREPNHLAIVEFDLEAALETAGGFTPGTVQGPVRTLAQLTTGDVESGDVVEPTHVEELREPGAGIREPDSQSWDGYRFRPVED
jgi:uncharacterized OB-fold protein